MIPVDRGRGTIQQSPIGGPARLQSCIKPLLLMKEYALAIDHELNGVNNENLEGRLRGERRRGEIKMRMYLIIPALLSSITAAHAEAFVMGPGVATCQRYLEDAKRLPEAAHHYYWGWAEGFMSASNWGRVAAGRDSKDLSAVPGLPNSVRWMDSYCSQHPQETFSSAVSHLYETLAETPGSGGLLWALARGRMYNSPGADVLELTQVVGSCNKEGSYVEVPLSGGRSYKTPIQCDKGALLQDTGNRRLVSFGYGNNSISFGGVYNKDDTSIVVNQLWPGPTPVDAVKTATINGVIDDHLEGNVSTVKTKARYLVGLIIKMMNRKMSSSFHLR
jgi:hypothetical protein